MNNLEFNLDEVTKPKTMESLIGLRVLIPYVDKADNSRIEYYRQIVKPIEIISDNKYITAAVIIKERWAGGVVMYVAVDYVTGKSITKENITTQAIEEAYREMKRNHVPTEDEPHLREKILNWSKKQTDKLGKYRNSPKILEEILNVQP